MLKLRSNACQCLKQSDFLDNNEVSSSPLELFMLLNGHPCVYVSSHNIWKLITFSIENIVVRIGNPRLYGHLQHLLLFFYFPSLTTFALVSFFHHLPISLTFRATVMRLTIHSGTYLNMFGHNAITFTRIAFLRVDSTFTVTLNACSVTSNCYVFHSACIDLLQSELYFNQLRLHLFRSVVLFLWVVEEIENVASCGSTIFDAFLSILVINLSLFRVCKDITGLFDSMESFGISSSVRVFFKCFFSECFFDLFCSCIFGDFQQFVVLGGVDFFVGLLSWALAGSSSEEHDSTKFNISTNSCCRCNFIIDADKKGAQNKTFYSEQKQITAFEHIETNLESQVTVRRKPKPSWSIDKLTTNYIPDEIVGRDAEKQVINQFVQDCITNRINAKVLYISGVPGVGKTASTIEILRKLEKQFATKVNFGFINALSLKRPEHVYKLILKILTGENPERHSKRICSEIESALQSLQKPYVIVIDEIDFLLTKDQQIFYNLFEWVAHVSSKLSLIIIANTMDFPQKLSGKINSRMGDHRLVFKPYSYDQIKQIIDERLQGCPLFSSSALTYISKKLSTYSSDMRTILQILHRAAAESTGKENKALISIDDVQALWDQKMKIHHSKPQDEPSLSAQILELLQKNEGFCNSQTLLDVLRQRGVSQQTLTILLKQMAQQGILTLKDSHKGMFQTYQIKLLTHFES